MSDLSNDTAEEDHIIDWREHYDHTFTRDVPNDELPETADEGVFVERLETRYGWYHDPESYKHSVTDEIVMTQEKLKKTKRTRVLVASLIRSTGSGSR